MEARLVLVTHPSGDEASALARTLVQEGVAACVNIVPNVTSIYRWQGKVEADDEALLIIKTRADAITDLEKRVLALHPYDTPEFVVIEPCSVNQRYLSWLLASAG